MNIDWAAATPVVAIVATALVGAAAVIVPALTRRGDRKHERQLQIRDQRAKAYTEVLALMHNFRDMAASGGDHTDRSRDASVLIWLWGSKEVPDLFAKWLKIQHTETTHEDRRPPGRSRSCLVDCRVT